MKLSEAIRLGAMLGPQAYGAVFIGSSADVCANHEACERNKRAAFRSLQVCLTCERNPATHYIADGPAYMLRCDECLLSNQGCPHAAPNICPPCYDYVTLSIHEVVDYFKRKAEPRPCISCGYTPKVIRAADAHPSESTLKEIAEKIEGALSDATSMKRHRLDCEAQLTYKETRDTIYDVLRDSLTTKENG